MITSVDLFLLPLLFDPIEVHFFNKWPLAKTYRFGAVNLKIWAKFNPKGQNSSSVFTAQMWVYRCRVTCSISTIRVSKYPTISVPDRVGYTWIFWVGFSGFSGIEQSQRTTSKPASNLIKITFLEMARPNESICKPLREKHFLFIFLIQGG